MEWEVDGSQLTLRRVGEGDSTETMNARPLGGGRAFLLLRTLAARIRAKPIKRNLLVIPGRTGTRRSLEVKFRGSTGSRETPF